MIKAYREIQSVLTEVQDLTSPHTWIRLVAPTAEEVERVHKETGLSVDFLRAALDKYERPRQEEEGNQALVLLSLPMQRSDLIYRTIPLGVVIGPQHIATVCLEETPLVRESSQRLRIHPGKRTRFFLLLLYWAAIQFIEGINQLNARAEVLEVTLRRSQRNELMFQLMEIQKSLVYFSIALKSNQILMEELLRSCLKSPSGADRWNRPLRLYPEDEDLLEDAITENKQALSMAEVHSNILSSTMGAFASIVSNNLNMVMKFLAAVTIILAIPTMIGSFYGMNIALPLQDHPWAFPIVMGVSILACAAAIWFLVRRRML
jgi:magnesium transporter